MSYRKLLLAMVAGCLCFASCKKTMSSDNPLPASNYPSIILNSNNNIVFGLNPATGGKNWQFSMPVLSALPSSITFTPSPMVYNDMVYLASVYSDTLYKISGKTGALVKKIMIAPHGFYTMQATPVASANLIYLATTNDSLYAIDTGTGAVKWVLGCGTPIVSSPVVYGNNVYVATTGGSVICVNKTSGPDPTTGNPVWVYANATGTTAASFVSSPCVSDSFLFVGSISDSNLYCIFTNPPYVAGTSPNPGYLKWTFKTGGAIRSSPTSYGGFVYFGSYDGKIYSVDTISGSQTWAYQTGNQVNSSPYIQGNTLFVGSYDYNLYAINLASGTPKWSFATTGLIKSSPIIYNGDAYIGSADGNLYAVDTSVGTLKWKYTINGFIEASPAIDDFSGNQYNSGISGFNTSANIN